MNLLILTQHFYPEKYSTGQLLTDLAESLSEKGFSINVISSKTVESKLLTEVYKDIKINRIRTTNFAKNKLLGRLINSLIFFMGCLYKIIIDKKPDILLIVSNPPFLPLLGWIGKKLKKCKFVYLVHDIYPDIAVNLGVIRPKGLIVSIWNDLNKRVIQAADATIVLGRCMHKIISEKDPEKKGNIVIIPNWCDEDFICFAGKEKNSFVEKNNLSDKFVVLYSGNLGLFHHLEALIYVAEKLQIYNDIIFLFVGEGGKKKKLQELARKKNLKNIMFLPYQPREQIHLSYAAADVDIITLERGAEGLGVPSKLYTIMASGRPIIALVSKNSEVNYVIDDAKCGFVVDQDDINIFKEKILYLYGNSEIKNEMGDKARKYFEIHFIRQLIVDKYSNLFKKLLQDGQVNYS